VNANIMQGVVTGIGFIGAGAIIRQSDFTTGHATAASIWTVGVRSTSHAADPLRQHNTYVRRIYPRSSESGNAMIQPQELARNMVCPTMTGLTIPNRPPTFSSCWSFPV